eukprot:TRINITY_DN8852_c0_g1_i1.p1 TRINITY_DN8852_c0_g1~~TRINITY_DN8852_c0_g1_i1.p1  ORF type:complete len:221 (-),score=29.56 TRINITY_DN8852_c0_g1_i1:15-677(-)
MSLFVPQGCYSTIPTEMKTSLKTSGFQGCCAFVFLYKASVALLHADTSTTQAELDDWSRESEVYAYCTKEGKEDWASCFSKLQIPTDRITIIASVDLVVVYSEKKHRHFSFSETEEISPIAKKLRLQRKMDGFFGTSSDQHKLGTFTLDFTTRKIILPENYPLRSQSDCTQKSLEKHLKQVSSRYNPDELKKISEWFPDWIKEFAAFPSYESLDWTVIRR